MSYPNIARSPPADFDAWSEWEWDMKHNIWVRNRQNERGEWDWQWGRQSTPGGPVTPIPPPQQDSPRYVPATDFSEMQPLGGIQGNYYPTTGGTYGQPANYPGMGGETSSYTVAPGTSGAYTQPSNFASTNSSPPIDVEDHLSGLGPGSQTPTPVPPTEEYPRKVIPSRGGGSRGSRPGERSNHPKPSTSGPSKQEPPSNKITAAAIGKELTIHKSQEFVEGKVFKVYWSEPKGTGDTEITPACEGSEAKGSLQKDSAYQSIRRFVIVRSFSGHSLCIPILTYGHRGTKKRGLKLDHHAIIYTSEEPPPTLEDEPRLHKKPIRVHSETAREKLSPDSRLNYAKVYTIEHNVEVCFIGKIHESSEHIFRTDFERIFNNPERN